MKHIRPKPIKSIQTSFNSEDITYDDMPETSKKVADDYLKSNSYDDSHDLAVHTSNKKLVFGFDYLYKGKRKFIPELDPCLIYFSNAQMFSKMIYQHKRELLTKSFEVGNINDSEENQTIDDTIKQFEAFFQFASNYIIMLSASLEAFLNKTIPINEIYVTRNGDKKDIEWIRGSSIEFKMSKIIPKCTKKDFEKQYPNKYDSILKIKNFRNDLIHLNPKTEITNTKYKEFYRKVIDFEYSSSIYLIRDYINFHENGLIEECPCGDDIFFDIIKIKK